MTTIWPAYEGSDRTSWYPDMQVLMTTSPLACVARPPRSPTSTNPSSSRRTIGSGMLHHPFHHDLALAQGHHDPSAQPPPGKGRVLSPALEGGPADRTRPFPGRGCAHASRSEEHTSALQSRSEIVGRLLLRHSSRSSP